MPLVSPDSRPRIRGLGNTNVAEIGSGASPRCRRSKASHGYRCLAHDRRGHDRSSQPWNGDDDQVVPIDVGGRASAKIVKHAKLIVYPGAPHGLTDTHKDRLNADLLAFLKS